MFSKTFENASIDKVEYSENGQALLVASAYDSIHILDRQNFKIIATLMFEGSLVNARFIEGGNKVFIADNNGLVQLSDTKSKRRLFRYRFPQGSRLADISEDADYIAYGGSIYRRSDGNLLPEPVTHATQTALKIHNNHILSAGYRDQRVVVRNLDDNTRQVWHSEDRVSRVAVVNDFIIACTDDDGDCYLWEPPNKEASRKIRGSGPINIIATHPRKPLIALVERKTVRVYLLRPFKKLLDIKSTSLMQAVTISDEGIIGLGEHNGTIQVWDIEKFSVIGKYRVENDPITALSFNSEQQEVLVGTRKGQALLLSVDGMIEKSAE